MAIESLGIGSSVLTNDLVDKIIGAEKELTEKRLEGREELVNAKVTAYGEIKSKVDTMENAMSALATPSTAGATTATSSDDSLLTATASSLAEPGVYNVEVVNTAKAHSLATSSMPSYTQDIGVGILKISFGEIEYGVGDTFEGFTLNPDQKGATIEIGPGQGSLEGIRSKINAAEIGVKANIINDGSGYRLVLTSEKEGVQNAVRIEAVDSDNNPLASGLGQIAYNEDQNGSSNLEQTSKAEDAEIRVNGLTITRDSNQVTEVVKGVTLNLKSADIGKQVTVEVEPNTEKMIEKINEFIEAYNELKIFIDDLTKFDAEKKQGGLLSGDSTVRTMMESIRSLLSEPVKGLVGTGYRSLTELGVASDQNNRHQLEFDQSKFDKAIKEERSSVVSILAKSGNTTDSQIVYVNDSINSSAGKYGINISQLATQATYSGKQVAALTSGSPINIDDTNDFFSLKLNGTTGSVLLTQGSYATTADLINEINYQIGSNETFKSKGFGASASFNTETNAIEFTSSKYGKDSEIYVSNVDTNTANTLGFNTLGRGAAKGQDLFALNQDAFNGHGASTVPANKIILEDNGINFSNGNATFSLAIDGNVAVPVVVNQNAEGNDLNSDGTIGDRKDTLQAIQTAIDATSLNGSVEAKFDKNDRLVFETVAEGDTRSIEITSVGTASGDSAIGLSQTQGAQTNGKNPGLTFSNPAEFKIELDGLENTTPISIPPGTYLTPADLTAEIENQISTTLAIDFAGDDVLRGGKIENTSKDLSTAIDFSALPAGFTINLSGVEKEIVIDNNITPGDNLANIQAAIDLAYPPVLPAGTATSEGITASIVDDKLVLSQNKAGHQEFIQVTGDGRGAQTTAGTAALVGTDFSTPAANATFTLELDGIDLAVDVNGNASLGSNDAESTRKAVEQAVNAALEGASGFAAGDILVKLDDSDQLYFESVSKDGVKSGTVFGHNAAIKIKDVTPGGVAESTLGLVNQTQDNGYDNFGFANQIKQYGGDFTPEVNYNLDADNNTGSLSITIGGNGTKVRFTELNSEAISILGLQDKQFYKVDPPKGQDVAGTINGKEAKGNGQYLTAQDGNVKATNGFYIANKSTDFAAEVDITNSNNKFTVEIDGVKAEVELEQPASYNSGEAMASVLTEAINETAEFKAKGIKVKVEYGTDENSTSFGKFGIISTSTGENSKVIMKEVSAEASNLFGFNVGQGDGRSGSARVGDVDDASGLRLKVLGGNTGDRGSLSYISGVADRLSDLFDDFLKNGSGVLAEKQKSFDQQITSIEEDRARLKDKVEAQETRLKKKFLYNDKIVNVLKTTESFIKQQFEAINNSRK